MDGQVWYANHSPGMAEIKPVSSDMQMQLDPAVSHCTANRRLDVEMCVGVRCKASGSIHLLREAEVAVIVTQTPRDEGLRGEDLGFTCAELTSQ